MNASPDLLALAGLLRELGVFASRAGWQSDSAKSGHSSLASAFVREFTPAPWRDSVIHWIETQHPSSLSPKGATLQRAGRLSTSASTKSDSSDETDQPQLLSLFSVLRRSDGHSANANNAYLPLHPLSLDDKIIFAAPLLSPSDRAKGYSELWRGFQGEMERLRELHERNGDLPTYVENLRLLLEKYTWCVPSSEAAMPDVSLYDQARTTAALAAVLADESAESHDSVALLVGGDLSGIQEFLYTITASGATPSLRGRSFYLQMLTEAAARSLLRALGLPFTCMLYLGGGNFTLLARAGDGSAIKRIQAEISRVLLGHHHGELSLACAAVELSEQDLQEGEIGAKWNLLRERLQQAKRQRLIGLAGDEMIGLFKPQGGGGGEGTSCAVCGREHSDIRAEKRDSDERPVYKCALCCSFEELGDDLRKARYLWISEVEAPGQVLGRPGEGYHEVLGQLGVRMRVVEKPPGRDQIEDVLRHLLLSLADGQGDSLGHARVAVGRRFLVNTIPTMQEAERQSLLRWPEITEDELPRVGRIKPFDLLERQSNGIRRLGVLRMDVDDMGELFRTGFGAPGDDSGKASLSRLAGLSFTLRLFFEGWLGKLAEDVNRDKPWVPRGEGSGGQTERLYAIYSGGDDLFFVGSWDAVIELAARVRRDLGKYANEHPRIHASAGVVLVSGKYPLYQAAAEAGEAERKAKAYAGKDAVTFLGETLPWSRFAKDETDHSEPFATVQGLARWLSERISKGDARSILRKVLDQYEDYVERRRTLLESQGAQGVDGQPQTPWGPWTWRSVYYLYRLGEGDAASGGSAMELARALDADYQLMERLGVAARWADYLTRG